MVRSAPCIRRVAWLPLAAAVAVCWLGGKASLVCGQVSGSGSSSEFELADAVQLDRADNAVLANLERAKAHLANRQWAEAIETFRQVMENSGGMLLAVTPQRFISVRDYCQIQLAGLPAEALALYRRRVDPLARKQYEDGLARLDRQMLLAVVEQAFASSWGDRAMMALGEMALERGDYASARWYWERILPVRPPAGVAVTWLAYPDTGLDLAAVRARLVLASILEGATQPRGTSWRNWRGCTQRPAAGSVARRSTTCRPSASLLAQSESWPVRRTSSDWPTFAGSPARDKAAADALDVGDVAWRVPIRSPAPRRRIAATGPRVAEDAAAPLSYYPVVVGNLVLAANRSEVLALDVATGKPAWGGAGAAIYREQIEESPAWLADPADTLGVPRHTLTVCDGKLYAHMGSSITSRPQASTSGVRPGSLICVDLNSQGRLLWQVTAGGGLGVRGGAAGQRRRRLRGHAADRHSTPGPRRLPRRAERQSPLAAFRLRGGDPGPGHLVREHAQPPHPALRYAVLQHQPGRRGRRWPRATARSSGSRSIPAPAAATCASWRRTGSGT